MIVRSIFSAIFALVVGLILSVISCSSSNLRHDDENRMMQNYSPSIEEEYNSYLVPLDRYSVKTGADLQRQHKKILVTYAHHMVEGMGLDVVPGSVGFYFDRNSDRVEDLYLGFDLNTGQNHVDSYTNIAVEIVKNQLGRMLDAVSICASVLSERSVVGVVVAWRWKQSDDEKRLSIWVSKDDVIQFLDDQMTFEELVMRSTITNSNDNIIRLPL